VLLVDTAGRLAIDEAMMAEIKALHAAVNPAETLFVVDAMTGQDAANTAKAFGDALPLTGVVLTKTDGDARGGAALSGALHHRQADQVRRRRREAGRPGRVPPGPHRQPHPRHGRRAVAGRAGRAAGRQGQGAKLAEKVAKGKKFDLNDMRDQLEQMQNMGGIGGLMDKLPGLGSIPTTSSSRSARAGSAAHDRHHQLDDQEGTPQPDLLNGSRRARIAKGSGVTPADVNKLMKQYSRWKR
jgi:signal recognition particle subunit SRP54